MLKAQDTAHVLLKNYETIDVCGSSDDKECTISIGIGEVKPEDEFYGFTFEASYNREKFIFNQPLYINTLAQFFDDDKRNIQFLDSGLIRGFAGTFSSTSVYGNMPLIAFKGRYIGQCPDTSSVRLNWLELTDEFKRVVDDKNKFVLVKTEILDKPNRSITAGFSADTVLFGEADSIGIASAILNVTNNTNLENIVLDVVTDDSENFRIIDTVNIISDKIFIDSTVKIGNVLRIFITTLDDLGIDTVFTVKIKELKRNKEGLIKELKIKPIMTNECACIVKLEEGNAIIKGNLQKDTTGTVYYEIENKSINSYYDEINDRIVIKSDKEIKEIRIFDMIGNLIKKISVSEIDKYAEIEADGMNTGIYLVSVKNINNEIKNIVMIKN